jgi:hypothetical protein
LFGVDERNGVEVTGLDRGKCGAQFFGGGPSTGPKLVDQ